MIYSTIPYGWDHLPDPLKKNPFLEKEKAKKLKQLKKHKETCANKRKKRKDKKK